MGRARRTREKGGNVSDGWRADREITPNRRVPRRPREPVFRAWHVVCLAAGLFALGVRVLLDGHPEKVEFGYSRLFYPYLADILAWPARLVPAPMSAAELAVGVLLIAVPVWICYRIAVTVRRGASIPRRLVHFGGSGLALAALLYTIYLSAWGINYLRMPFFPSLESEISPAQLKLADYAGMAEALVQSANILRPGVMSSPEEADPERLDRRVNRAVRRVVRDVYGDGFPEPPPTKTLAVNRLLNATGISGFFFPFFMEPHVNADLSAWERPCTMAHEKAHFMGFASETDASLIAYIACLTDESPRLRYSGALRVLPSILARLPARDRDRIRAGLDPAVVADLRQRAARLDRYRRQSGRLMEARKRVNDAYLKLNAQKEGIRTYGAAIPRLVAWWWDRRGGPMESRRGPRSPRI